MGATMWGKRSLASTLAARSLAVLWLHGGHSLVLASEPAFDAQAIRVDMTIKAFILRFSKKKSLLADLLGTYFLCLI